MILHSFLPSIWYRTTILNQFTIRAYTNTIRSVESNPRSSTHVHVKLNKNELLTESPLFWIHLSTSQMKGIVTTYVCCDLSSHFGPLTTFLIEWINKQKSIQGSPNILQLVPVRSQYGHHLPFPTNTDSLLSIPTDSGVSSWPIHLPSNMKRK